MRGLSIAIALLGLRCALTPDDVGALPDALDSSVPSQPGDAGAGFVDAGFVDAGTFQCTVPQLPVLAHDAGPLAPVSIHTVDTRVPARSQALCNDGTKAMYAHRAGSGAARNRWILYLDGGAWCSTDAACLRRRRETFSNTSSAGLTFPGRWSGILDDARAQNPDFFDASWAYLHYCSSDSWSGDRAPLVPGANVDTTTDGWHFRGRGIVRGVIDELIAERGLGEATEVLLVGSSAGGFGSATLTDDVRAWLPAGVRYLVVSDASLFIDSPPFDVATGQAAPEVPSFVAQLLSDGTRLWAGSGALGCPDAAVEPRCRLPEALLREGHLATPLLLTASLKDPLRLSQNGIPTDGAGAVTSPPALAYLEGLEAELSARARAFDRRHSVALSPDPNHVTLNRPTFTQAQAGGRSMAQAVGDFYRSPCAPFTRIGP